MAKPLSVFSIRLVLRVAGIEDNQPNFFVAAPSRAAAIRAFETVTHQVTVNSFKTYGHTLVPRADEIATVTEAAGGPLPDGAPGRLRMIAAALAEPGVVFATASLRPEAPIVRMPVRA